MKLLPDSKLSWLQRHPISGIYYVKKYLAGKGQLEKSTGETDRRRAEKIGYQLLTEFQNYAATGYVPTFGEIAELIIREKTKSRKRKATIDSAKTHFEIHFKQKADFWDKRIDRLSKDDWDSYVSAEWALDPERRLFNHWKHFVMVMTRARRMGYHLAFTIKDPDPEVFQKKFKVFSESEIVRLLHFAKHDIRLQILQGYLMGMRRKEILTQTWSNIDLDKGVVNIPPTIAKIKKGREIAIHPEVLTLLRRKRAKQLSKRFYKKYGNSPYVFPNRRHPIFPVNDNKSAWRSVKALGRVSGRFHDLRHTFITKALLEAKQNVLDVSLYVGASVRTLSETYIHPNPEHTKHIANTIQLPSSQEIRPVSNKKLHRKKQDKNLPRAKKGQKLRQSLRGIRGKAKNA